VDLSDFAQTPVNTLLNSGIPYQAGDILTILMTKFQKECFAPKSINLCPASN